MDWSHESTKRTGVLRVNIQTFIHLLVLAGIRLSLPVKVTPLRDYCNEMNGKDSMNSPLAGLKSPAPSAIAPGFCLVKAVLGIGITSNPTQGCMHSRWLLRVLTVFTQHHIFSTQNVGIVLT